MSRSSLSRRKVLAVAAAASLAGVSTGRGQVAGSGPINPTIGISTLGFRGHTNAELARELAAGGIKLVQLFFAQKDSSYWKYNDRVDLSAMTADRARAIADTYRAAGITVHSLGVYTNLIHPDPAERGANLDYFETMMKLGAAMDVRCFVTESGHYHDPDGPEPRIPLNFQDATWTTMLDTFGDLARRAAKYDATILLEPMHRSFFASAKRLRCFIEELGSPRVRALLDPANLIEVNDLPEMFQQLGPYIDCMHAKDRKLHVDRGVAAGQGDVDYPEFVTLAARHAPRAPLVLEYVGPNDYQQALSHLKNAIATASRK